MDDSKIQQINHRFTDNRSTASEDKDQRSLTLPPAERGSVNDDNHEEEGFQAFVLGYN